MKKIMKTYSTLPDIQETTEPEIKEPIDFIGIQKVKMPLIFVDNRISFTALSEVSMGVNLSHRVRAASLSEFMRYLKEYVNKPLLIPDDISKILKSFHKISRDNIYWNASYIKFEFDYKKEVQSPVSENSFPEFYKSFYKFQMIDGTVLTTYKGVTIPYSNYCPCSKSLCDHAGKGIPHSQKSYCDLIVKSEEKCLSFDYMIKLIKECVVNKTYPIIRRMDEQNIAIKASENTFFIEDIIRRIRRSLKMIDSIDDWIIRLRHIESIHQHEVIAIDYKGEEFGFNETNFF